MKQLNCCTKKEQKCIPAESFINLYLRTGKVDGGTHSTLALAQRLRMTNTDGGITIKIERTADDDFNITKVEEF